MLARGSVPDRFGNGIHAQERGAQADAARAGTHGGQAFAHVHGFMMQNTTGNTAVAFAPGADSGKSEVVRRLKSSAEIKQLGTFIGLLGPLPFFPALEVLKRLESR